MEILAILEALEDIIERSTSVPFTGKSMVDKEEVLEIIKELRLKLPDEVKQAKWISDERQKILLEAQQEADNIINSAESKIAALVDENEITKKAYEQAKEIIANAQKNAREIRIGTREYADDILDRVQKILLETVKVVEENRNELK